MKVITIDPTIKSAKASEAMYKLLMDFKCLSNRTAIIVVRLPNVVKTITAMKTTVNTYLTQYLVSCVSSFVSFASNVKSLNVKFATDHD